MASKQKKSSMKKETRSNSAKISASLKEQLISKEKLEDLTNQNEKLQKTIQTYKEENGQLRDKVEYLGKKNCGIWAEQRVQVVGGRKF